MCAQYINVIYILYVAYTLYTYDVVVVVVAIYGYCTNEDVYIYSICKCTYNNCESDLHMTKNDEILMMLNEDLVGELRYANENLDDTMKNL